MGRSCTICLHPDRAAIDRALVSGTSFRDLAGQWSVTKSALHRHKTQHLPGHLVKAQEEESIGQAIDVVRQLKAINAACLEILQTSRAEKKHSISLKAVDRIERQISLQAKLLGELQETGPTVNVLVAPEWREIKVNILAALTPFPEARSAVSKALTDARP
jgi:hypothetical protein